MTVNKRTMSNDNVNKKQLFASNRRIWPFANKKKFSGHSHSIKINNLIIDKSSRLYNRDYVEDPECFQCAISYTLCMAQIFGLFPLCGLRTSSPSKLQFKKAAPRTIYAYIIILFGFLMALLSIIHMFKRLNASAFAVQGGIADATAGAVFYGNNLFATVLFFRLASKWPPIQKDWRTLERFMDKHKNWIKLRLRWKFYTISSVIFIFALVEHILSIINSNAIDFCSSNATFETFLETYIRQSHAFILSNVEYNFTIGMIIFIMSKLATFTWNFMDVFIMLVSTGLAERYRHLNNRMLKIKVDQFSESEWIEIRENYAMLSTLVKKVDNNISSIILLSFANNLYFICLQLLNGLSPTDSTITSILYYFGSFLFLIGRTVAVTLFAARINDQSKVILPILYNCPASTYTIETQRLQQQITTDEVALSGSRFFSITRNFMLAVAGAIVTYEVVLLQFNIAIRK